MAATDSNRRPDEEGITTSWCRSCRLPRVYSNRRPDEEGITTRVECVSDVLGEIQTADLMKKGLRLVGRGGYPEAAAFKPQT